jgi:hypothetical protein
VSAWPGTGRPAGNRSPQAASALTYCGECTGPSGVTVNVIERPATMGLWNSGSPWERMHARYLSACALENVAGRASSRSICRTPLLAVYPSLPRKASIAIPRTPNRISPGREHDGGWWRCLCQGLMKRPMPAQHSMELTGVDSDVHAVPEQSRTVRHARSSRVCGYQSITWELSRA